MRERSERAPQLRVRPRLLHPTRRRNAHGRERGRKGRGFVAGAQRRGAGEGVRRAAGRVRRTKEERPTTTADNDAAAAEGGKGRKGGGLGGRAQRVGREGGGRLERRWLKRRRLGHGARAHARQRAHQRVRRRAARVRLCALRRDGARGRRRARFAVAFVVAEGEERGGAHRRAQHRVPLAPQPQRHGESDEHEDDERDIRCGGVKETG